MFLSREHLVMQTSSPIAAKDESSEAGHKSLAIKFNALGKQQRNMDNWKAKMDGHLLDVDSHYR